MAWKSISSAEELPPEVNTLVVLGKQFGFGNRSSKVFEQPYSLSDESRMNLAAAGYLWQPGRKIILSGNKAALFTFGGLGFLTDNFPYISFARDVQTEGDSPTTIDSGRNVAKILSTQPHALPALVTIGYHGDRAAQDFYRSGLPVSYVVASEDIVAEHSPEEQAQVEAWRDLSRVRAEIVKEKLLARFPLVENIGGYALKAIRP